MPRALEEKIHNIWQSSLKTREFKNRRIRSAFEKLDKWRQLSYVLVKKYKEYFREAYEGKERLTFNNEFEYFPGLSGEYLLLTRDLLSIFTKGKMPVFVKNFPIFVQLKSVPVFWINCGIITLWDFYFETSKINTVFEEILRFSDKIAIFPRLEFASFNFIQTYTSKPDHILPYSSLEKRSPHLLEALRKYLTKNFWIIPEDDVKDVNPFCFVFLKDSSLLPCTPHRMVFKVLDHSEAKTIYLLGTKIDCIKVFIYYLNSSGDVRSENVFFPRKLTDISLEKGKIYNGLFFTFIDFDNECIFPILFSFYEEDLHSYEIFQELLLLFFRRKYLQSGNICSIEFNENELWSEIKYLGTQVWRKKMLPFSENIFLKLEKENALRLLFSGLYPVLINSENKMFYVPPPLGLLGLNEEKLKKLIEWYEAESFEPGVHAFTKLGDVITSFLSYQRLVKDVMRRSLHLKYLKELVKCLKGMTTEEY